jgi:hypothetical protein
MDAILNGVAGVWTSICVSPVGLYAGDVLNSVGAVIKTILPIIK